MGPLIRAAALAILALCLTAAPAAAQGVSRTFTVNTTGDGTDASPGDGLCSITPVAGLCTLRAAVQESNASGPIDTIVLPPGTYNLTLTGGLFSRSPQMVERVAQRLPVGNLYVNRHITGAMVARQPFGGNRRSGIGSKAGGPDYLLQFVEPRVVTENTMRHGLVVD